MKHLAFLGVAHIHTPGFINAIKKRPDTLKVKTVWDPDAARAKRRADELGAAVSADFKAILADPAIDAIVVCSETDLHEQLVIPAAEAKKHLFVEKPLGMTSKDAYAMASAVEKAGVMFTTGYFQRGDPKNLFLKQHVAQGSFGKITRVRGSNCHSGALGGWFDTEWRWMADPKRAGCGAFGDLGTHSLDILLWLLGEVEAATAMLDGGTKRYGDCDETGEGLFRFKNGAIGTLAAAWDDVANPVSLLISGTDGHAAIINGQLHFQSKHVPQFDGSSPVRTAELPQAQPAGLDLFLDAVTGKPSPNLVGVREAAYRVAVMEALYEGSRLGRWVAPK
jgi:predicted dehydrogenase